MDPHTEGLLLILPKPVQRAQWELELGFSLAMKLGNSTELLPLSNLASLFINKGTGPVGLNFAYLGNGDSILDLENDKTRIIWEFVRLGSFCEDILYSFLLEKELLEIKYLALCLGA